MVVRRDKKSRNWIIDLSLGTNIITGKRKRLVRKFIGTKNDALVLESELNQSLLKKRPNYDDIRIEELFTTLMREDVHNQKKPSYIQTQKHNYNRHLKEYFENATVVKLNYDHVFEFREYLSKKGLSNNTVNKIMILLKRTIDIALRKGYMEQNPCKLLKKLPVETKRMKFWTLEEFNQFRKLLTNEEINFQLFFTLAFFTGMRSGELLGLTWEDIDFRRNEIYVNKTLVKVNGQFILNSPKTRAGERFVTVNKRLMDDLLDWKHTQYNWLSNYQIITPETQDKVQVFQKDDKLLHKDNVRKKYDAIFRRDTSLTKIRIHDLRHSHVALLINNGEDPYMIKERIGHASIQTIYDLYGHLYPSKQISTADKLDSMY